MQLWCALRVLPIKHLRCKICGLQFVVIGVCVWCGEFGLWLLLGVDVLCRVLVVSAFPGIHHTRPKCTSLKVCGL